MPRDWDDYLEELPFFRELSGAEQDRLVRDVRIFIDEKQWTPVGEAELTDRMKVQIAAQAMRLVLRREHDYYDNVTELLIHPAGYEVDHTHAGTSIVSRVPVAGQAVYRGPVILSWTDVQRGSRVADDSHNVVYHEFAHALDFQDGVVDGTPPLADRKLLQRWIEVMSEHFEELVHASRQGRRTVLRKYGATNPAEFFAVATEMFFENPDRLRNRLPDLYDVLADYYHQDPAEV